MDLLSKLIYKNSRLTGDSENPEMQIEDEDASPGEANLVTSVLRKRKLGPDEPLHAILLDVDVPAALFPSTTPGNSHLYIQPPFPLTEKQLFKLLDVLTEVGIIQPGFAKASKIRGYTALRPPWVRKEV